LSLKRTICLGAAVLGVTASTGVAAASAKILEAGSSLVYPLASVWATHYSADNVVTAAGGSVAGIQDIQHGSVDIGASDAPMTAAQYTGDTSGTPVQLPWALTATGIGYNVPGVRSGLKLTAAVLAKIYTGKITTWGDPAIVKLNPADASALKKAGKITAVYRSDGSGDSYVFQRFLKAGAGSAWPYGFGTSWGGTTGVGALGNGGVASEVKSNTGTIGYMSISYLIQQHITTAQVQNAAGEFTYPNPTNIEAAASSNTKLTPQGPSFTGISIVYPSKAFPVAYPISTYTYAIVNKNDANLAAVQAFLKWVINPAAGQQVGENLGFVSLPGTIRTTDQGLINSL
jgi:phosphate transport system substrate-binding protein